MKKIISRLRRHFLALLKLKTTDKASPKTHNVFDIQEKIQEKIQNKIQKVTKSAPIQLPPIPMAQVTIQTIQIPMVDPSLFKQAVQESLQKFPDQAMRTRQPNVIRKPLSEKDIADMSSVLKSFHGGDVRDLF